MKVLSKRTHFLKFDTLRRNRASLAVCAALLALVFLSGCASPRYVTNTDPWSYNATTGYPAVGGGFGGL